MDIVGKVLTLVIEITDETADWIYSAQMKSPAHGMLVRTIANGNLIKELDDTKEALEYYEARYGALEND